MNTKIMSRKKYYSILDELNYWKNELNKTRKKIGETTSLDNDLRENPEYLQLTQDLQYKIPNKINQLNLLIKNVVIIDENYFKLKNSREGVSILDSVTLEDENGNLYNYIIVGYDETDINKGWVSYESPIISKILNKKVGYVFEFKDTEYEIVNIDKGKNSYIEYIFS